MTTFALPDNAVLRLELPGNRTLVIKHTTGGQVQVAPAAGAVTITVTGVHEDVFYE